jgi:ribosomal protein L11 methyltransferase
VAACLHHAENKRVAVVWAEVSFQVRPEEAELAAFLAREATGAGIQLDQPVEILGPEQGYRLLEDEPVTLRLYLPVLDDLGAKLAQLREALDSLPQPPELTSRPLQEEDWAESWKEFYDVMRVGQRTVIKPSWKEYDPRGGDVVIELDPGQAFGTGQHETTRLCLELLEGHVRPGTAVLDAGCGSGILAIAAAKHGAAEVVAIDVDPLCVRVASENVAANRVDATVTCHEAALDDSFARQRSAQFATVVANIISDVLIGCATALATTTAPGGSLIASGIILEREDETRAALEEAGFRLADVRREGNWAALLMIRK